jgi:hypothetical protein
MSEKEKFKKFSFEEFKLYYESTEKVTDRRLSTNKLNYSISITIILSITYVWKWANANPSFTYVGFTISLVISIMAMLFCSLWIGQIKDFKLLNNAKFEVLNEMADNLVFDNENLDIISSNPFQKEWDILKKLNALQDSSSIKIVALKSSNIEYYIPKAFKIIFILIIIISVIPIVINFNEFIQSWRNLIHL